MAQATKSTSQWADVKNVETVKLTVRNTKREVEGQLNFPKTVAGLLKLLPEERIMQHCKRGIVIEVQDRHMRPMLYSGEWKAADVVKYLASNEVWEDLRERRTRKRSESAIRHVEATKDELESLSPALRAKLEAQGVKLEVSAEEAEQK